MAANLKISEEEKKRLQEIYGSIGDNINPETGYAAGVGFGNAQRLAQVSSHGAGSGGKYIAGSGGTGSQGQQTLSYGSSSADYIARLTDSMNKANAAALNRKYNTMLKDLDRQRAAIGPGYYEARNQAAAENAQSARNYGEYAAARGIGTGAAAQSAIAREAAYMANLGNIGRDEAQAYADIEAGRRQLKDELQGELARALAEGEVQKYQQLLEQHRADQASAYNQARDTADDERWQREFDYKMERDALADKRYLSEWDYKLGQAAKKGSSSSGSSSSKSPSAKSGASDPQEMAADEAFEEGFSEERPEDIFRGEKGSTKPFANNTQKKSYQEALKIWEKFYTIGFPAFAETVSYLKRIKASRAVIEAVFDHLPGFAGLNAWYYAIEYGGLEREYYEKY
jgi:hypothetical protein